MRKQVFNFAPSDVIILYIDTLQGTLSKITNSGKKVHFKKHVFLWTKKVQNSLPENKTCGKGFPPVIFHLISF